MNNPEFRIEIFNNEVYVLYIAEQAINRFTNDYAKRYLRYGFSRRYSMLIESKEYIFKTFENQKDKPLSLPVAGRLSLHLNTFYLNLRGCLDNLAYILTYEYSLLEKINSNTLRHFCILISDNFISRLSKQKPEIANELQKYRNWYKELKKLRDPGAHRLPLSFITSILNQNDKINYVRKINEYNNLLKNVSSNSPKKSLEIMHEASNVLSELNNIGKFEPIIVAMESNGQEMKSAPDQLTTDMKNIIKISHIVLNDEYFNQHT